MEETLSRAAVEKVIRDQMTWWEKELNSANLQLPEMTHRFKTNSCTMDGLILFTQSHRERVADIQSRMLELYNILNAIERL